MPDTDSDWAQPKKVDDVTLAFPAGVVGRLMPEQTFCERALRELPLEEREKWLDFQNRWFGSGLPKSFEVDVRDDIDGRDAFRHLKAIQGSFEPHHEHKVVAVAYLASRWFNDIAWDGFHPRVPLEDHDAD